MRSLTKTEEVLIQKLSEKEKCGLAKSRSLSKNLYEVLKKDSSPSVQKALEENPVVSKFQERK